ncbi:aminotransferase class IV [Kitasatospora sp. NPDC001309]|uniref:aminotransferase class IV n=1 Tax=Kitasatospora sp. NPDC001309 TaxID=3364013 RepID=UPI0036D1E7E3
MAVSIWSSRRSGRAGRWFPRVECTAPSPAAGFRLRLRPAPTGGGGVVLRIADGPDVRNAPTVKGPDLPALLALRAAAERDGADEALLVTAGGLVLEGAVTGVLWWRGDALCAPAPELPVLPSITRRLIMRLAAQRDVEVRYEACRPEELDGLEVWTVNALHGIRPVTGWLDRRLTAAAPVRAAHWQAALLRTAVPLERRARTR